MKIINIGEDQNIQGISIRTNNANEMNSDTGKIPSLYQTFDEQITVDYKNGARVYGVYFNYESDASGDFTVLAGADHIESSKTELEKITLPAGKYMLFEGKGEMPQVVIDLWKQVWQYFSDESSNENSHEKPVEKRSYQVDFEHYLNQEEVMLYISIK